MRKSIMCRGQTIVEMVVAIGILIIISSTALIAILGSLSSSRLAKEEVKATLIAAEGIEAAESIRNQDWDNLTNGDHGVASGSGVWVFSGESDVDASGRFTRVVAVSAVQRDTSGDIVESGGSVDPDTKRVVSTVTWDFTSGRSNSVDLSSYLTNWQLARTPAGEGGPAISTCTAYCSSIGYSSGTCRADSAACTTASEDYKATGDQYCVGGTTVDTCCCAS